MTGHDPDSFGPYKLLEMLGTGGISRSDKAKHPTHGVCVLNRLKAERGEYSRLAQIFLSGGFLLCHLRHEKLARGIEWGKIDGIPFYSMEYLCRGNLQSVVYESVGKEGQAFALTASLDYPDAELAQQVSDGLAGLMSFLRLFPDAADLGQLLDKIEVSARDSRVTIAARFTVAELEDALKALRSFEGPSR